MPSDPIISLNELPDSEHNAWFKCFATRKEEKKSAFDSLMRKGLSSLSAKMEWMAKGLLTLWFGKGATDMEIEITPEMVTVLGKKWKKEVIASLCPEEIDEFLSTLKPERRLAGLKPKDVLASFKPEDIEAYLKKIKPPKKIRKRSR